MRNEKNKANKKCLKIVPSYEYDDIIMIKVKFLRFQLNKKWFRYPVPLLSLLNKYLKVKPLSKSIINLRFSVFFKGFKNFFYYYKLYMR